MLQHLKITLRKLLVAVNIGGNSIRGLEERSAHDGGNFWPLWLVILKTIYIMLETLSSHDMVGREL